MNKLQIFNNPEFGQVRTITIDGEPWFIGKDIAVALGYENTKDALKKHVDSEDKIMGSQNTTPFITDSMGRIQYPTWINESGLYSLIISSKLPNAKKFKRWVTSEILPAIRKTGTYSMKPDVEVKVTETVREENPEIYLEAARIMASVPDSQPYVINCLRHVVSDIDINVPLKEQTTEVTLSTESKTQRKNSFYYQEGVPIDVEKLKITMAIKHISNKDIAENMGVTVQSVNRWLSGKRPILENRTKLCTALGEDKDYLTPRRKRNVRK